MSFFLKNLDFYIPLFMRVEAHVYTGWRLLYFCSLIVVFCANIGVKYSRYWLFCVPTMFIVIVCVYLGVPVL